ncbi:MAG TPA: DUF1501 domain-containing protein [Casimicrobiaceae bacterium]|nr:DUF1501 domain-containing protein [Casimicrobiaceae bacterium]
MDRRRFLQRSLASMAFGFATLEAPRAALPALPSAGPYRNLLVLIELKGGNDGFNTLVPFADPTYYALRPKLAISRDAIVQLSDRAGLHPALAPLEPLWKNRELAILQGVGYPEPNLSHFRSIEIWDTASAAETYLQDGWLTRTFAADPPPPSFAADGVIVGSNDLGPLAGSGTRTVALADTEQFLRRARLAAPEGTARNKALDHILKVEADIVQAASHLDARREFRTEFPADAFGKAIHTACQVIANPSGVAVVRLTLGGFDTHGGQAPTQARLLGSLAGGIVALRSALVEIGRWDSTLVVTYAEFGRRPRENVSGGTDHGTANVHFALGGRVAGGFYGDGPRLDRLGGDGNVGYALDFRGVYATVLERWWGVPSAPIVGGRFPAVPFVRA